MASDIKKILMFDESTGMLSKEVMTAYIYNELSPSLRQDVEKFLANDEMHRDIIEGLKQIRDRNQVEKAIHSINERIADQTGAPVSSGGVSFELPEFFSEYKKIAAIGLGFILLSGIIFTLLQLRESPPSIASNETELVQNNVNAEPPQPDVAEEKTLNIKSETPNSVVTEADEDSVLYNEEEVSEQLMAEGVIQLNDQKEGEAITKNKIQTASEEKRPSIAAKKNKTEDKESENKKDITTSATGQTYTADASELDDNAGMNANIMDSVSVQDSPVAKINAVKLAEVQARATDEVMPAFPGGEAALREYIYGNLRYPKESKDKGIEGTVDLSFFIGTSGRVKNIRVTKGVSKDINAEAIRIIANMPKWKPGKEKGKSSTMKQYLTIDFSIE